MKCEDRQQQRSNTAKKWPNDFHASPREHLKGCRSEDRRYKMQLRSRPAQCTHSVVAIIATAGTACRAPTEENATRPFLTKSGAATAATTLQQKAVWSRPAFSLVAPASCRLF
jgi:hypothetical protein